MYEDIYLQNEIEVSQKEFFQNFSEYKSSYYPAYVNIDIPFKIEKEDCITIDTEKDVYMSRSLTIYQKDLKIHKPIKTIS